MASVYLHAFTGIPFWFFLEVKSRSPVQKDATERTQGASVCKEAITWELSQWQSECPLEGNMPAHIFFPKQLKGHLVCLPPGFVHFTEVAWRQNYLQFLRWIHPNRLLIIIKQTFISFLDVMFKAKYGQINLQHSKAKLQTGFGSPVNTATM